VPEAGAVKAGEIPDWLKSYSQQESQPSQPEPEPASAALPAYVSPFGDANLSEWMHADQSAQEAEQPESGERSLFALGSGSSEPSAPALSFAGNEVNEWLGTSAEEQGVIDEAVANARQDNLEMAPLPAWLQAMRPVESAAPSGEESVNDQRVEKSGPLAG
jgi:hypothetical protein